MRRMMLVVLGVLVCAVVGVRIVEWTPAPVEITASGGAADELPPSQFTLSQDDVGVRSAIEIDSVATDLLSNGNPSVPPLFLSGIVRVYDAQGQELAPIDGNLVLRFWKRLSSTGSVGANLESEIRQGRWSLNVVGGTVWNLLSVERVECNGMVTYIETPKEPVALPADGSIEIEARIPRAATLRVLDAHSGIELDDLIILSAEVNGRLGAVEHPGSAFDGAATHVRSPVDVMDVMGRGLLKDGLMQVLVGREGYAWTRVVLDGERGGERVVGLEPSGNLEVDILGIGHINRVDLVLYAVGHREPFLVQALQRTGPVLLQGLAPKEYLVSVEVSDEAHGPSMLTESPVTVLSSETVFVVLDLESRSNLPLVSATGRVLMPKAWGDREELEISLECLDSPSGNAEPYQETEVEVSGSKSGYDIFEWTFGGLQVGQYKFEILEPSFVAVVSVPIGGLIGCEVRIPPPIRVALRVIDAASGAAIEDSVVAWSHDVPQGVGSYSPNHARKVDGVFEFVAPGPEINLSVSAEGYVGLFSKHSPRADGGIQVVALEPLGTGCECSIRLELRDGSTRIPPPASWRGSTLIIDGPTGPPCNPVVGPLDIRWSLNTSGTYSLHLPKVSGYLRPSPQSIDVRPNEVTLVVVELQREH